MPTTASHNSTRFRPTYIEKAFLEPDLTLSTVPRAHVPACVRAEVGGPSIQTHWHITSLSSSSSISIPYLSRIFRCPLRERRIDLAPETPHFETSLTRSGCRLPSRGVPRQDLSAMNSRAASALGISRTQCWFLRCDTVKHLVLRFQEGGSGCTVRASQRPKS